MSSYGARNGRPRTLERALRAARPRSGCPRRPPSGSSSTRELLAGGGRALDVACGDGRNALYLAQLGYMVDAIDVSDVAIDALRAHDRGSAG